MRAEDSNRLTFGNRLGKLAEGSKNEVQTGLRLYAAHVDEKLSHLLLRLLKQLFEMVHYKKENCFRLANNQTFNI